MVGAGDKAILDRLTAEERGRYLAGEFDRDDFHALLARDPHRRNGNGNGHHAPAARVNLTAIPRPAGPPPGVDGRPSGPELMSASELQRYVTQSEQTEADDGEAATERDIAGSAFDNDAA